MKSALKNAKRSLMGGFALSLMVASSVQAEDPPPFKEFTFKRVKPPASGSKRITVQIAPRGTEAPSSNSAPETTGNEAPSAKYTARYDWFWEAVSPNIAQTGPGRLAQGVEALGRAPTGQGVPAPRLQLVQDVARAHGRALLLHSISSGVSPAFALAVIIVESGGKADAQSSAGAQGLMQLIPATAERFDVTDALDPAQNIAGGMAYLGWLKEKFDGDPILMLAGYNAGENAVLKNGGVPPFAETRDYVPKVLAAWTVARGLCVTPPLLMTDGCVFAVPSSG